MSVASNLTSWRSWPWRRQREIILLSFPRRHNNSWLIKKMGFWGNSWLIVYYRGYRNTKDIMEFLSCAIIHGLDFSYHSSSLVDKYDILFKLYLEMRENNLNSCFVSGASVQSKNVNFVSCNLKLSHWFIFPTILPVFSVMQHRSFKISSWHLHHIQIIPRTSRS